MNTDIDRLISKTKVLLLGKPSNAFLAYALLMIPIQAKEGIGTACTDGITINVDPVFFTGLNLQERQFLLAHELLHILLHHTTRLGNRDPRLFNIAADYVINQMLYEQDFVLIEGALHDTKYIGMTTEQVYELLKEDGSTPPSSNMLGDIDYQQAPSNDPTESTTDTSSNTTPRSIQDLEEAINGIIAKATLQADMANQGASVPSHIREFINNLQKPKVNWRVLLQRYLFGLNKSDHTWTKPRKRLLNQGFYLPSLHNKTVSKVSFAIDTSGSVSDKEFQEFLSEVGSVFKMIKPESIDILVFDHALQLHENVDSLNKLAKLPFKGGGGTEPVTAIQAFMNTDSKVLFIITDGYFNTHNLPKPTQPVVWVIYNNEDFLAPYGDVIHVRTNTS